MCIRDRRCLPSFLSRRSASTSLATACRCALPDRAVPKISAARCLIYPRTHLPHPRARRLTPRTHPSLAEEGLARARRGALRRVADGGGVLLRRQVRREGAVRFPGRILRASTRNSSRGSRFAKTTLIQHRESRSPSPPCSRAQGETLQAHQRASHGVRDPLWQGDRQAQGEQKAPRRGAGTPRSPTRLSRKAVACRVSRIPPCRRCA